MKKDLTRLSDINLLFNMKSFYASFYLSTKAGEDHNVICASRMNEKLFIIVVTGPPASGKTTLGISLAQRFRLPLLSKDQIKENLFTSMGSNSREDSARLGKASIDLLWQLAETFLQSNCSVIVESNFDPKFASTRLSSIIKDFDCDAVQVLCNASKKILIDRFIERIKSGERHTGHHDSIDPHIVERSFFTTDEYWLEVPSSKIEIDTTDFALANYSGVLQHLDKIIGTDNKPSNRFWPA